MQGLAALYPKLAVGGYIIIDDFQNIRACGQAVLDYRARYGITDQIVLIDTAGAYWKKTK